MSELHPVEYLFKRMDELVTDYPEGKVIRISERIAGTAFFPGSYGLWGTQAGKPLPDMPVGGVMVLGHNFDCEENFKESLKYQGENSTGRTWDNLKLLLEAVDIPKERCFFTNFYMGLKPGDNPMGKLPAAANEHFVRACQVFFREQLKVMQPKIILVLGKYFLKDFAEFLPPGPRLVWSTSKPYRDLDQQKSALVYQNDLSVVPHPAVIVALTHPSMPSNTRHRSYGDLSGKEAELKMLKDALKKVGGAI